MSQTYGEFVDWIPWRKMRAVGSSETSQCHPSKLVEAYKKGEQSGRELGYGGKGY